MKPVRSGNVRAVGYDSDTETRFVDFNNGSRLIAEAVRRTATKHARC